MENRIIIIVMALVVGLAISCRDEVTTTPALGKMSFALAQGIENGRTKSSPQSILVTIVDSDLNTIFGKHKIDLYAFGAGFISESLELPTGHFLLTEFFVLDEGGEVIYAAPLEGTDLAHLVIDPLPVDFLVEANKTTSITVDVLDISESNVPSDFGYATFSFNVVESDHDVELNFKASTNPGMITNGYDSVIVVFAKEDQIISKKLTIISPIEAKGVIKMSELMLPSSESSDWTIDVHSYHESIDEVEYNVHINESHATSFVSVPFGTTSMSWEGSTFYGGDFSILAGENVIQQEPIIFENWAHLFDLNQTFWFLVKNDLCNPSIKYELKQDGYFLYYSKNVQIGDKSDSLYEYRDFYKYDPSKGVYFDTTSFASMCVDSDRSVYGSIQFEFDNTKSYSACYLVWETEDTPIDPEKRTTANNMGSFKAVTPGAFQKKYQGKSKKQI